MILRPYMEMAQGNGSRYLNTQTNGWVTKIIMFFKNYQSWVLIIGSP